MVSTPTYVWCHRPLVNLSDDVKQHLFLVSAMKKEKNVSQKTRPTPNTHTHMYIYVIIGNQETV